MKCCKYCKKEFNYDYGKMGYIDHVDNFSENPFYHNKKVDTEDIVRTIIMDGNDYRHEFEIKDRLNCFLTWDDYTEEDKQKVRIACEKHIPIVENAYNKAREIYDSLSPMEKYYIKRMS